MDAVNEMLKFFRHTESIFQPVHKTALWILIIIKVEWNVQTYQTIILCSTCRQGRHRRAGECTRAYPRIQQK